VGAAAGGTGCMAIDQLISLRTPSMNDEERPFKVSQV
jgi:hypothetical protein